MESKNESIQLTRICITTTFPVGEKWIFFSKIPPGKISYSIVLVLYTYEHSKTTEKTGVLSFSPWIGCQRHVYMNISCLEFHADISNPSKEIKFSNKYESRNRASFFAIAQFATLFAELMRLRQDKHFGWNNMRPLFKKKLYHSPGHFISHDLIKKYS